MNTRKSVIEHTNTIFYFSAFRSYCKWSEIGSWFPSIKVLLLWFPPPLSPHASYFNHILLCQWKLSNIWEAPVLLLDKWELYKELTHTLCTLPINREQWKKHTCYVRWALWLIKMLCSVWGSHILSSLLTWCYNVFTETR